MQKIGIVRIYSRKKSFGNPSLEKAFLFSWFVTMVAFLPTQEKTLREAVNSSYYALPVIQHLRPLFLILPYIAMATAGVAAVITVLYFLEEYKNRSGSVAKYIFLASVLGLYGYFLFDFLVAFVAFGFSHSIEYIAFAVIYMRRKYAVPGQRPSLARTVTMNTFSVFLPLLVIVGIVYLGWDQISTESLGFFYVATSFLHYLYDGWIWKVRKPGVGQPLGLAYPSAT